MTTKVISTANAEHYQWGGPNNDQCDAWYLLKTTELNIIEELMPPGTSETRHYHQKATQLMYVLSGELTLEIEHQDFLIQAGECVEIAPGQAHQAKNQSGALVRFLVTSQPPSHGDKFPA